MSKRHSLAADLLALRAAAKTAFEHDLVSVLTKQYGLITALQLQMHLMYPPDVAKSETLP